MKPKQQWHSGFDDSSGWGRLIDPVCLFILCQIAGTLWVIIPHPGSTAPPTAELAVLRVDQKNLPKQREALVKALDAAREQVRLLRDPQPVAVTDRDRQQAELRTEQERLRELQAEAARLGQRQVDAEHAKGAVPGASSSLGREAEQIEQQASSREAELRRLQADLGQVQGAGDGGGIGSPRLVETDLELRPVHFVANRAIPLDGQHYKIERGRLKSNNREVVRFSKKVDGETIEELGRPGSDLMAYLLKMDPGKQFLFCMVTSDSLPAFRAVRRLAQGMKIKVAWDTNYDSDGIIVRSTESSGNGKFKIPER